MRSQIERICIAALITVLIAGTGCTAYRAAAGGPLEAPRAPEVVPATQGVTESRLLVRRAWITVVADDIEAVAERAAALAGALGGYVQTSREGTDDEMAMTIRVPSAALDAALDSIAVAGDVEDRRIAADDVTEQVIDLEGRVASLRATRDRLRELLGQASGVADVITVERELQRVQADLESLERRLVHLRGSSALADLTIEAHRPRRLGPVSWLFVQTGNLIEKLFVIR